MPVIRILSDRVANQIAAGEVIERPAAVVKELVENSLDAGATRIEVEFRHGGRSYLRVEDNGRGMGRDDALLALERHATSKIVETADLDHLATFGFRGEALPSIASIARFELQTRPADQPAGTEILVNGGKLLEVRDCGMAPGTRIIVQHLFHAVPARRKFLKSDATESAHVIQTVRLYALACPGTAFTLVEDGRVLFQSPSCTSLHDRVAEILGRQLAADLLPLSAEGDGMRLSGLVGRPGVSRATRHELITFVNQRPVDSRTLNYALIESYATSLAKGRYPVAVVFLDLSPAAVDVNVHPAKREIRFRWEGQVRGFVIRAVLQRLREAGIDVGAPPLAPLGAPPLAVSPPAPTWVAPLAPPPELAPANPVPAASPGTPAGSPAFAVPLAAPPSAPSAAAGSPPPVRTGLAGWRFLGTGHVDYLVFEAPGGLVVVDRRAAHERIWFEELQRQFKDRSVPSQRLLFPVPLELDAISSALLLDRLAWLAAHGIEVAEFGRNFFRIEAVPDWIEQGDAANFLRDLVALVREGRIDPAKADLAEEEMARHAATKAIRLGPVAGEAEALGLMRRLFGCMQPHASPMGRPTLFELSHGELARRFQR